MRRYLHHQRAARQPLQPRWPFDVAQTIGDRRRGDGRTRQGFEAGERGTGIADLVRAQQRRARQVVLPALAFVYLKSPATNIIDVMG